jgi:hypothetical protein
MKLERISAADQIEFPKAKPLSSSQSVWKRSALAPEKKRMIETIRTRACERAMRRSLSQAMLS